MTSLEMFFMQLNEIVVNKSVNFNLPKYSFHYEHQSHFSELSGRAQKTLSSAGESGEVDNEKAWGSFKELIPESIRDW